MRAERRPAVRRRAAVVACVAVSVLLEAGCGRPPDRPPAPAPAAAGRRALLPVSLPDVSRAEPALRERLQVQYAALERARGAAGTADEDLARTFGEMGKLLVAAEFLDAAEPALSNARALSPGDRRWPYYLGHLHRLRGEPDAARTQFEDALRLAPGDAPTLIWLARILIDDGRPAEAAPLLTRALAAQPASPAALLDVGRVALAERRFGAAVEALQAALAADPKALSVHYPLAAAYRGLGDARQADAHLRLWKEGDLLPADPLMEEIGGLLQTALGYAVRGVEALDRKKPVEAVAYFRKGLELAPSDPVLHLNLGTALYLTGEEETALAQFREATRLSPGYARAHFSLGVLMEGRGRDDDAIAQFTMALRSDAGLADARFALADALRRTGQVEASLDHYAALVRADPSASQARFGYAMGLVGLGRYQEARAALEDARAAHPDQVGFTHALARLLAAAPDDQVRDGRRAHTLAAALRRRFTSAALTETWAMVQAERGQFDEAVAAQRAVLAEARAPGPAKADEARLRTLTENLALYERRQPCRRPWSDADPVFHPRAASAAGRF